MRDYEITFILIPSLDEAGVKAEVEGIKKFISSAGGEITVEKEWGRRRLQFPIRDFSEGVYHILRFRLPTSQKSELERFFRLNEKVLRHLVIRDEGLPLDHIGQASSEFEERDRDSRDRRPGPPRRYEESRSGSRGSSGSRGASAATAEAGRSERDDRGEEG
ncbi:MAG: 30S ribosomal protein S6 [bacterium]